MICRRCGNRVPEYLTTKAYFQCPSCGRKYGTPPEEQRREPAPRAYGVRREARYEEPVRRERGEVSYNNRRAGSRFVDDDYYENRQPDYEPYQQDFEPEIYEEPAQSGGDFEPDVIEALPATMKLTTLIGFEALALIALAVVWLVSLGL